MIPQSAIEEWRNGVLWKTDEQYLIICHAMHSPKYSKMNFCLIICFLGELVKKNPIE